MSAVVELRVRKPWMTWIFNPFHYVAGVQALAAGAVVMLLAGGVNALTHSHFDGLLDFHTGAPMPPWIYSIEGPINWIVAVVLFYAAGRLIAPNPFRLIDVAGTQALARAPMLLAALAVLPPAVQDANKRVIEAAMNVRDFTASDSYFVEMPMGDLAVVVTFACFAITMLIWMLVLMYRAFAVSCNVSGGKAIGLFVCVLVTGEIVTKFIFFGLYTAAGF